MASNSNTTIAYFSMEIALETSLPTYSGGLGVLAGDTIRAAADLGAPMVAVTLLHRKGYFIQQLDAAGRQSEQPVDWNPETQLEAVAPQVTVEIEGRTVHVRAWRYVVRGETGHTVPVYLLDTALSANSAADQVITDVLYGGDADYRLAQTKSQSRRAQSSARPPLPKWPSPCPRPIPYASWWPQSAWRSRW